MRSDFPGAKSPHILQLTSRNLELPLALELERDSSCTLIFGNLPPLDLSRSDSSVYRHECSLLALRNGQLEIYDCRSRAEIGKANRQFAGLFVRDENGTWISPVLTQHLAQVAVSYRLISNESINPTRAQSRLPASLSAGRRD